MKTDLGKTGKTEIAYTYQYTTEEGGEWLQFITDLPIEDVLKACRDPDNRRGMPESPFTLLRPGIHPFPGPLYVHSLKFPDGRIWDSTLGGFDPGYPKHKAEKEEGMKVIIGLQLDEDDCIILEKLLGNELSRGHYTAGIVSHIRVTQESERKLLDEIKQVKRAILAKEGKRND